MRRARRTGSRLLAVAAVIGSAVTSFAGCGGASAITGAHHASHGLTTGVLLDEDGELGPMDRQIVGGAFADRYELHVPAGAHLAVDVVTTAFDPTLDVSPPGGAAAQNDDWNGDRTRSHVDVVAGVDGIMKIQVASYGSESAGAYRLTVRTAGATTGVPTGADAGVVPIPTEPPGTQTLQPGQHAEGVLDGSDPHAADGSFTEELHVTATSPEPVTIHVVSQDRLRVLCTIANGQTVAQQSNGVFVVDGAQTTSLRLFGAQPGATARWAVSVDQQPPAPPTPVRPTGRNHATPDPAPANPTALQLGTPVQGTLAPGDLELSEQEFADVYAFDAPAGPRLRVQMTSSALDSYVIVIGPDGARQEDDDSGGGRNSLLQFDVPAPGHYLVYATSYGGAEQGAYTLVVSPPHAPVVPNGQSQVIRGQLKRSDHTRPTGEYEDTYVFNLTAGTTVRFELGSAAFDTYLIVTSPAGAQEVNDDIQSGNTNSLLEYDVLQTGPHKVTVSSYGRGMMGNYILTVTGAQGGTRLRGGMLAPVPGQPPAP